jgi:Zn-dependent metalloprotease
LVVVSLLMAGGAWFVSHPAAQSARAVQLTLAHFNANRGAYGLADPSSELQLRSNRQDARGVSHVKFDQVYRGLRVFEGEAVAHVDANDQVTVTNALRGNLNVSTSPRIGRAAAVETTVRSISPAGAYDVRDASLWILPRGERSIMDRLVWHVAVAVENDFEDPAEWRYFVDASSGSVAFAYDALPTGHEHGTEGVKPGGGKPGGGGGGGGTATAATGTAKTMYSGDQAIDIAQSGNTFLLRDLFQLGNGNYTCDMANTSGGSCTTFSQSSTTFGDNSKTSGTRATAGGDAHFGLQATLNYYFTMFGRNGINGAGRQTFSRVHYGRNYENAFWSDSCFCMTYGDGASTFYPLVSLDVAGHEMSHGVMAAEANLTYSGESGGLNESNSDIFGTLVEFSVNSSADVPDYWIGERIYRSNWSNNGTTYTQSQALRYMDDPDKDGRSPSCYYPNIGALNVHYSSGPNNYMFYLLSHGGTSQCTGATVTGVGNDKAARIWYKAISDYMTASSNYAAARQASLDAAAALYGNGSPEYSAVAAAYAAINVP